MQEPVFSYVPGASLLHRLDPRTKIVAVMLLGILTFRIENFAGIGALFALFFALASLSGLPMKIFFRAVRPMMLFIIFIFLAQLFFTDGRALAIILGSCSRAWKGWKQGSNLLPDLYSFCFLQPF